MHVCALARLLTCALAWDQRVPRFVLRSRASFATLEQHQRVIARLAASADAEKFATIRIAERAPPVLRLLLAERHDLEILPLPIPRETHRAGFVGATLNPWHSNNFHARLVRAMRVPKLKTNPFKKREPNEDRTREDTAATPG